MIIELQPLPGHGAPVPDMRRGPYRAWRSRVESFKAVQGMRPMLDHVSEHTWAEHFAANEDAFSAVVFELERVDG